MAILIEQTPQFILRKNHRQSFPRKILYLDTETKHIDEVDHQRHRMSMAWTCYNEKRPTESIDTESWQEWRYTYPLCKYIESLCHDKTVLYLFGHNVFFDLQVSDFYYYFTKWGWELDFIYDSGATYILTIHKGKRRIKALSTTNFYNTSVEKLGQMIGLQKLAIDFEKSSAGDLSIYCKRDVEIIKTAMERYYKFIGDYDLGKFSMTRASQAFSAFRHRFMAAKIYVHRSAKAIALEQDAYIGGRVECAHIGEVPGGPFCALDINSMYPYVMSHYPVPVRLLDYRENPPLDIVEESSAERCGIADCDISTDKAIYPLRSNGKIIFPLGAFRTTLTTPELREAFSRGHIRRCHRYASYESEIIFKEYVDFFYAMRMAYRDKGDTIHDELCKNFLNYLYGKFGQYKPIIDVEKDITYDGYYRLETIDLVTGRTEIEYKLFNTRVVTHGREIAKTSLIAVAAHVTAYARLYLYKIMEELGIERVLYCDTDCMRIRAKYVPDIAHLINPKKLGALKIEEEYKEFTIYGPKSYRTEHVRRIKGVPQRAVEYEPNRFKYVQFLKQPTHMRKQVMRYAIVRPTIKVIRPHYDKGVLLPSGDIRPFHLELIAE